MGDWVERARQVRRQTMISAASNPDEMAVTVPTLYPAWSPTSDYIVGDRVRHGDLLYRCLTAHTAQEGWTPDAAPSLWVRIDDSAVEWPEWRQPTGATDAYALGAKVSHDGKRWVSTAGHNVWEPGVSGWEEQQ